MTGRARRFEWVDEIVEKNRAKHGIEPADAETALLNTDPTPYIRKVADGKYLALCQVEDDGPYLVVVFAMPRPGITRVISVRAMDSSERTEYRRRREGKQNR
jgi:uncharacterized DUF497 family protein